jgi:galactonate dehydratase
MKITGLKVFVVNSGGRVHWGTGYGTNWIFVKIYTDEGISGLGEAFGSGKAKTTETAFYEYERWLRGKDPTRVIHNWNAIYRGARYPLGTETMAALSAVEQALWDIAGKKCGLPVYRMLGGPCRDRIRLYASGYLVSSKPLIEVATEVPRAGFTALKVHPDDFAAHPSTSSFAESIRQIKTLRELVGEDVDICLDYSGISLSPSEAVKLARGLEPYRPFFLEEPALSENPDSLLDVKNKTVIPIAAGERCISRQSVREVIEKRAVHIIQPEPAVNGGILETVKLAAMAEMYHIMVAPHHSRSLVSLLVCAHIDACLPNFLIQECSFIDSQCARDLFMSIPRIEDGYLELPDRPGLGIELNEDATKDYPYKPFDRPVIINKDGSIGLA